MIIKYKRLDGTVCLKIQIFLQCDIRLEAKWHKKYKH